VLPEFQQQKFRYRNWSSCPCISHLHCINW